MSENQTKTLSDERRDGINKLEVIKAAGIKPYAAKYDKQLDCGVAAKLEEGTTLKTAGRLVLVRDMGKICFVHLQDLTGKVQAVFRVGEIEADVYKQLMKIINIGDHIGVEGEIFKTQKGEISILVKKFEFLSKALRPLPEKFHGLKDTEIKYRQRYLDLIMNEESREVFKFRTEFLRELRNFYAEHGFTEVDTPVLVNAASGALAKPFKTHYNALDLGVYLRIAPEIYLKEAIIGGYDKIFEIARCFRNEGMDSSHLQEFSMVEHYAAYWDYEDNMNFTEKMLATIIKKLKNTLELEIINRDGQAVPVNFTAPWRRVSFRELLIEDCGIDIDKLATVEELREAIKAKNIAIENIAKLGRGNLIDSLYKVVSRPKLINPTFLLKHPLDLSPLARKNDENPLIVDRFQLIINGWEVINAYSELIDPIDQVERFAGQTAARDKGDDEAMLKDDEYVTAMEYGLPPTSGLGMGIERIVALLTNQSNLRDVILFPLLRPENGDDENK